MIKELVEVIELVDKIETEFYGKEITNRRKLKVTSIIGDVYNNLNKFI